MEQKIIRNFEDFSTRKAENILFVNDFKQLKTLLNNYWQNNGLYFTIEQYSDTDADITIYDNDGRFSNNKKIANVKATVIAKDNKCDIFYNGEKVTLTELNKKLTELTNNLKQKV